MASNPSITQYPPGIQLPHEPGPSNGQLPSGEGCYHCDHDFGELPLTRRSKRSVIKIEDGEEDGIEGMLKVFTKRSTAEVGMTVGEIVRTRRSADPTQLQRRHYVSLSLILDKLLKLHFLQNSFILLIKKKPCLECQGLSLDIQITSKLL